MMKWIFNILLMIWVPAIHAQSHMDRKSQDALEDADIYLEITDYHSALDGYRELIKKHPDIPEIELKMGKCQYHLGIEDRGEQWFLKAIERKNTEINV